MWGIFVAGASAEGEVNHWPAFVDVLTTVIMVVTFLLVIMSAAVMVLSQRTMATLKAQYEQKKERTADAAASKAGGAEGQSSNAIRSPADAETGSSIAELGSILQSETTVDGSDKLTIRTRETPDTMKIKVKALEESNNEKGVQVKTADVLMRVDFEPMAVRYDDENSRQVMEFLKTRQQPGMKFEIWSFAPQTSSISEAQRLAFYRAAMTRNLLIKAGIAPSAINTQVRITDPTSREGHNVRVVLKP